MIPDHSDEGLFWDEMPPPTYFAGLSPLTVLVHKWFGWHRSSYISPVGVFQQNGVSSIVGMCGTCGLVGLVDAQGELV